MESPYNILGVTKEASDEEIKKAFKKLAKELHPDKTQGDPEKENRFKQVREAYDKIKNAKAREELQREEMSKQYARQGFHRQSPFGDGQGFHYRTSDIDEDILNEIFGNFGMGGNSFGGGFARSKKENKSVSATINLSFWEAVKGGEKVFSFPEGSKISVNIPAGIKEGQSVRLKGQANKLQTNATGDLLLKVKIGPDSKARYLGDDILLDYDLPIDTAVLGGQLQVRSPLGNFVLNVPAYTHNGAKFKLKGKGPKGSDLIVRCNLQLPKEKKEDFQKLFRSARP